MPFGATRGCRNSAVVSPEPTGQLSTSARFHDIHQRFAIALSIATIVQLGGLRGLCDYRIERRMNRRLRDSFLLEPQILSRISRTPIAQRPSVPVGQKLTMAVHNKMLPGLQFRFMEFPGLVETSSASFQCRFELLRADAAEITVAPGAIVEAVDVISNVGKR
jgi:hypothetical protein